MSASSVPPDVRLKIAARTLRLLDAPGLGPFRLYKLLETHGDIDGVERYLAAGAKVPDRIQEHVRSAPLDRYISTMRDTLELGGDFLLWDEPDYPANLSLWGARPAVLFYRGDLSHLGQRSLALVGRVDPTPEGEQAAYRFARMCVEHDITVVSGLAKGIDGASHRAALASPPGYTYAVVGHGLDFSYPAENHDLYEAIPNRGAVISQFPLGIGPQRWTFPARNEAMCTLALGTVIVEGKPGCGSIIQADFSFKHGRPVFLLSRNLRVGDTSWAEALVAKGAHVIERFPEALEVVQKTMGELWSETSRIESRQGELFPLTGSLRESSSAPSTQPDVGDAHMHVSDLSQASGTSAMSMPVSLLFDIDGVIADSRATTAAALAQIVRRHTGREVDPTTMKVAGAPYKVLAAYGVSSAYNVYRAEYDRAFDEASATRMRVFPEVVRALMELKQAGIRIGAITAQPRRRAERLLPPEVRQLFDLYYTYNETGGKKEAGIKRALKELGVLPDRAAYIGDTPTDLEAARSAGVRAVGVGWGFTSLGALQVLPHDLMLHRPADLSEAIVAKLFS